jgi:hypothetical protein
LRLGNWTIERDALTPRIGAKGREALKGLIPNFLVMEIRQMRLGAHRSQHESDWVWRTVPPDRIQILRTHLDRLLDSANADRLQPVLVTHANRFAGARQDTTGPARRHLVNLMSLYYPQATPQVLIGMDSAANALIRESGPRHGAIVVDAERQITSPSSFADFLHFTDAGADQMARLIVEGILHATKPPVRTGSVPHVD